MNGKLNAMDSEMRDLTPEELEQVEGGGMKEILAAVTLAAMAATSPVAAGLAEELTPAADAVVEQMETNEEAEAPAEAEEQDTVETLGEEAVEMVAEAETIGEEEALATEEITAEAAGVRAAVEEAVADADIMIIIGTSMVVYPAAGLIQYARRDVPVYLIDPNDVMGSGRYNVTHIKKGASAGMEELFEKLTEK